MLPIGIALELHLLQIMKMLHVILTNQYIPEMMSIEDFNVFFTQRNNDLKRGKKSLK